MGCSAIQNPWFRKAELEEELWARPAELTNVSLLPLLLSE